MPTPGATPSTSAAARNTTSTIVAIPSRAARSPRSRPRGGRSAAPRRARRRRAGRRAARAPRRPTRSCRRSPARRPSVIVAENAATRAPPGRGRCERLLDVDRAPVRDRALAHERAEADRPDGPQRARRASEQRPRVLARVVRVAGEQRPGGHEARAQAERRDADQVPADVEPRSPRARWSPPRRARRRRTRRGRRTGSGCRSGVDRDAVRVHGNVERAVACPQQQRGGEQQRVRGRERRQRQGDAEATAARRVVRRLPSRRHPARHRHRHQRPQRDEPERQPELGLAQVEASFTGMRAAHEPRRSPLTKKMTVTARRAAGCPGPWPRG